MNLVQVTDEVEFGDSWRKDIDCDVCEDCEPTICINNPQHYQQAKELCNVYIDGKRSMNSFKKPVGNVFLFIKTMSVLRKPLRCPI